VAENVIINVMKKKITNLYFNFAYIMIRFLLVLSLLLSLLFLFSGCKDNTLINRIKNNVVKIKVLSINGDTWEGSGIFIQDNLIITAGHIVDGAEIIDIIFENEDCYKARNWYLEDVAITDLGFIDVNTPQKEKQIKFIDGEVGETVWALGNPFGMYPSLTKGIISNLSVVDEDYFFGNKLLLYTDCPVNPGNSGCPLYNKKGIVGICVGGIFGANDVGFCIPAKICQLSLEKYLATKKLQEAK